MRILITNHRLAERTGTEIFTGELALELRARGHEIAVLTWEEGMGAEALEAADIPVATHPGQLPWAPDLIHGQHHLTVMAALAAFPGVPALFHCHGYAPWEEQPPRHPRILAYVGTAERMRPWLGRQTGAPPERVHVVENGVNLVRFKGRSLPLPKTPRRALLFDNYAKEGKEVELLRSVCRNRGMDLDLAGRESERPLADPESVLPGYDLVFAVGRSALEAAASGCSVVILNTAGLGGHVTGETLPAWRKINFTVPYEAPPLTAEALRNCLDTYDAKIAGETAKLVREEMNLSRMVDKLEGLYRGLLVEPRPAEDLRAELAAAAEYMATLGPYVCEKDARFTRLRRDRDRAKRVLAEYKQRTAESRSVANNVESKGLINRILHALRGNGHRG